MVDGKGGGVFGRAHRLPSVALIGALLVSACSAAVPSESSAPATGASSTEAVASRPASPTVETKPRVFTGAAAPVSLASTADQHDTASATIGAKGGSVSATGSDGTTYTLIVPEGALLFDATISVTPLSSIGALAAAPTPQNRIGVQLAPDGLVLSRPATLLMHPAAAPPKAGVSALSFHGGGSDAGLTLFGQSAGQISVRVHHFSGYGSFWPVDEEWWRVAERLRQQQIEDRLANQVAARIGRVRQQQLMGETPDSDILTILLEVVGTWDRDVLDPARSLARNGCREATDAVSLYLAWERQLQLLGDDGQDLRLQRPIPTDLLTLKRDLCFEEQFQRCAHTGDFEGLMGYFLGHFRQYELYGVQPPDQDVALAHMYLQRCGRWDLDVKTIFDERWPRIPASIYEEIDRHFKIKWSPGDAVYGLLGSHADAEAAPEVIKIEGTIKCAPSLTNFRVEANAKAEIVRLVFDHAASPSPQTLKVRVSFGVIAWDSIATCPIVAQDLIPFRESNDTIEISVGLHLSPDIATCERDPACASVTNTLENGWRFDDGPFHEGPFSAHLQKYGFLEEVPASVTTGSVEANLKHTPGL